MQIYESSTSPTAIAIGSDSPVGERESANADSTPTNASASSSVTPEQLARANGYAVLGALLAKVPTNELLTSILPSADSLAASGDLADSWRRLAGISSSQPPKYSDGALDDEYHALFIGVVRGEVMPYGSWYMSGFLMDKPLAALRRDLQTLGFERVKGVREPEDHAGALCETMAMIIQSDDVSERAQKTFFEKHMRPWMQLFFKDLEAAKSAEFYGAVAQFGRQFIAFEKQYFDI